MRKMAMVVALLMLVGLCPMARAEGSGQDSAVMGYVGECFAWEQAQEADPQLPEMVPVYAAPSEGAWRGANGRAAVSLTESLTLLGHEPDSDWLLIEYDISPTERRIGYIYSHNHWSPWVSELSLSGIGMRLAEDATLTDDPRASVREIARLHGGDEVSVLGCVKEDWFYVETEIDGKTARGFIPVSAAELPEMAILTDVMDRMEGVWGFSGGAEVLGEGVIITADGSLLICDTDDYMETPPTHLIPDYDHPMAYAVYPTDPEDRRFWSKFVIVLQAEKDSSVYGLSFYPAEDGEPESMHIEWGPSGGFYARYDTEPTIDARE